MNGDRKVFEFLNAALRNSGAEHVDWLETRLALVDQVGIENYLQAKMG